VGGQTYSNIAPMRWMGLIHDKPPGCLDWFENREEIELYDAGVPSGYSVGAANYQPNYCPPVTVTEYDYFEESMVEFDLINISSGSVESVVLTGSSSWSVFFEGAEGVAFDDDGDGRDEVVAELTDLSLTGTSSMGAVSLSLNSGFSSMGIMEEVVNNNPGWLDVNPFAPGFVDSFFDVFFNLTVGGQTYSNIAPMRWMGLIHDKPPGCLDWFENREDIELYDASVPSGYLVGAANYQPNYCPS